MRAGLLRLSIGFRGMLAWQKMSALMCSLRVLRAVKSAGEYAELAALKH